jgi:hypothetical protein
MAALNLIVMVVCALWLLAYLDRHTKRAGKGRRQSLSSKTRLSDNPPQ